MAVAFGIGFIIFGFLGYAVCAVPKSEYEQRLDDEAQMQYLKEDRERHS